MDTKRLQKKNQTAKGLRKENKPNTTPKVFNSVREKRNSWENKTKIESLIDVQKTDRAVFVKHQIATRRTTTPPQ